MREGAPKQGPQEKLGRKIKEELAGKTGEERRAKAEGYTHGELMKGNPSLTEKEKKAHEEMLKRKQAYLKRG